MKTQQIEELNQALESTMGNVGAIKLKLQKEYNKYFDSNQELQKVLANAESATEYQLDEMGEIESWFRANILEDFSDCREYFENYLSETNCMRVDWVNSCLLNSQGDSLIIQDDCRHRRDNGVWFGHKQVISQSDYWSEEEYLNNTSGEIDTEKRNQLIEQYMEKTGYFLGVFRVDRNGNVFLVNTQKKD